MSTVVRHLPEVVINRVAAGEVVERPSAVVKELVENAIDAGATIVEVSFRRAGKDTIIVRDNGNGMSREDALLAMERHATSKIFSMEDLEKIASFGFRGEALPSIASVSSFTLSTQRDCDEVGTEILIEDGLRRSVRECVICPGTHIRVAHLFQSVPARRKFLKTDQTEANHIIEIVRSFAIAFPRLQFRLHNGTNLCFETLGQETLASRLQRLFGENFLRMLLPVSGEADGRRLSGFVLNPLADRRASAEMYFFVNHRAVVAKELKEWLLEVYAPFLPGSRAVDCVLFLELPPQQVDVNVHPTKREVRFSNRLQLKTFFTETLKSALREILPRGLVLATTERLAEVTEAQTGDPELEVASEESVLEHCRDLCRPAIDECLPARREIIASPRVRLHGRTTAACRAPIAMKEFESEGMAEDGTENEKIDDVADDVFRGQKFGEQNQFTTPAVIRDRGILNWRYVGKLDAHCALFSSDGGLIFFDLRAAAIRIHYEKLRAEVDQLPQQHLLMPIQLDLRHHELEDIPAALAELRAVGFDIEVLEEQICMVSAIPLWLDEHSGEAFLYDWLILQRKCCSGLRTEFLLKLAARHGSEGRTPATEREITELLNSLMHCDIPALSPDGTAIYFELSNGDIQRRWARNA
ncbi:MAG: DNA mismatch repair endonuclease MutL [Puniceicoccales bacterium]|jgi:DNA mismatch repair protein MutL|nr:DNA mismatch repair endonuclease MutL [Puniceicoccales bacterium]